MNFDGECSPPVREFMIANAGYWIDEFRLDGLRLDATQSIHDRSSQHLVAALTARAFGSPASTLVSMTAHAILAHPARMHPPIRERRHSRL